MKDINTILEEYTKETVKKDLQESNSYFTHALNSSEYNGEDRFNKCLEILNDK